MGMYHRHTSLAHEPNATKTGRLAPSSRARRPCHVTTQPAPCIWRGLADGDSTFYTGVRPGSDCEGPTGPLMPRPDTGPAGRNEQ